MNMLPEQFIKPGFIPVNQEIPKFKGSPSRRIKGATNPVGMSGGRPTCLRKLKDIEAQELPIVDSLREYDVPVIAEAFLFLLGASWLGFAR